MGIDPGSFDWGPLGFGAAGIANLYREVDDDEAWATLEAAWDGGVRYFDTAPHYGLGLSERRLGRFLSTKPRDQFILSTKVGRLLVDNPDFHGQRDTDGGFFVPARQTRRWDLTESGIRRSLAESLQRLGLDRVDIVYLHDPEVAGLAEGIATGIPALTRLRDEDVVTGIGVGSNSVEGLLACVRQCDLDLIMLAGRYTLLEQPALGELLPACLEAGTGVVAVGVFNSGILASPVVDDHANYNYTQAPAELLVRARTLAGVCAGQVVDLPTAALQYPSRHPAVRSVTIGVDDAAQLRQNLTRIRQPVPDQLWSDLAARGLIPPETYRPEPYRRETRR